MTTNSATYLERLLTFLRTAAGTSYDNATSGLAAENVQDAIDEVADAAGAVYDAQSVAANPTGSSAGATSVALAAQSFLGRAAANVAGIAVSTNSLVGRSGTGDLGGLQAPVQSLVGRGSSGLGFFEFAANAILMRVGSADMATYSASAGQVLGRGLTGDLGFLDTGILTGSSSPEAAVTAAVGRIYVDTSTGNPYYKRTGSGNTGWAYIGAQPWIDFYLDTQTVAASAAATITALGTLGDGLGAWTRPSTTTLRAPMTGRYAVNAALHVTYSSTSNPSTPNVSINVNGVEKARAFGIRYSATAADPVLLSGSATIEVTDTSHDITFTNTSGSFTFTTPATDMYRRIRLARIGPVGTDV